MDTLDRMKEASGNDYLIIMDNASYHTQKNYPKKSATKRVKYDWLTEMSAKEGVDIDLGPYKDMRVWELDKIIEFVIMNPAIETELYTIDKLAKERNYEVVRMPPYSPYLKLVPGSKMIWL